MDADGNCLVVFPCNICKQSKNGVQVCLVRKHNARLMSVKMEDLTSRHRQCVKPDQSMTIFKLVDRDTGEESVEYAQGMVFQRPCDRCQHLKSCIMAGHTLQDWVAEGNDSRSSKRKSMSSAKSPPVYSSRGTAAPDTKTEATTPATSSAASAKQAGKENVAEGYRPKRRKVDALNTPSDPSTGFGAAAEPKNGIGAGRAGSGTRSASTGATSAAGGSDTGAPTTAQNIAARLQEMSLAEDRLRQQYQSEMQNLDKAEVKRLKEIEEAKAALERIHLIRKATRDKISEQRKEMSVERQRLINLHVQAIIQEEKELRQKKEVLWRACEARSAELRRLEDEAATAAAAAAAASPAVQEHGQAALPPPRGMLGSGAGAGASGAPNGVSSVALSGGGATGGGGLNVMNEWSSPAGVGGGRRGDGNESEDSDVDINVEGGDTDTGTGDTGGKEGLTAGSTGSSKRGDAGTAKVEGRSESPAVDEESMVNCHGDGTEERNEKAVLAETEEITECKMNEGEAGVATNGAALVVSEKNGGSGHSTVREGDGKESGEVEAPREGSEVGRGETQGGENREGVVEDSSCSSSKNKSESYESGKIDELVQDLPNDDNTPAETADNTVVAVSGGREAGKRGKGEVDSK